MTSALFTSLELPHGRALPNRLAKAAMEEHLAGPGQLPDERIVRLYRQWGSGGVGLMITGNVMVDARALTSPGGLVLDGCTPLGPYERWAATATAGGSRIWMQINHPGRQVYADMPGVKIAPSAVALDLGKQSKRFRTPEAMTEHQICEAIDAFVTAGARAAEAGFDGVQVHAAHGYLLSQFLSPLANRRTDEWGGSLENRSRALTQIIRGLRRRVPADFAVAVKINSADFQRGGFDVDDARALVKILNALPVDLVEVSGGTFESPAMQGMPADERTLAREAYFLTFAEEIRAVAAMPLMLTGGVTRRKSAEAVLSAGIDVVGIGTALSTAPDLAERWRSGDSSPPALRPITWRDKALASSARQALVRYQLHRLAKGKAPAPRARPAYAFARDQVRRHRLLGRYRDWLARR